MLDMEILSLTNVKYSYTSQTEVNEALKGVSFSVCEGEFVTILGKNGSGKSTLAKTLNGLIIPQEGEVRVYGVSTREADEDSKSHGTLLYDIRSKVGMVFQNPDNQMVAGVVEDDIAFGPENLGVEREEIERRIDWSLEAVGMSGYRKADPSRLSGGQKQRIAIAGALALNPRILVLDESTAMLDPMGRSEIMELLLRLNKEEGITIILVTHYMEEALISSRVIVMEDGRVRLDGVPREVFADREVLSRYSLSLPPILAIQDMLCEKGVSLPISYDVDTLADHIVEVVGKRTVSRVDMPSATYTKTPIVDMKGVSFAYMPKTPFETKALKNINLTVRDGELLGIIGHTGSGKSTLIQHFNGLIKVQEGEMTVCGYPLHVKKPEYRALRREVGMVFQYPEHQLFAETVYEDVAFGPRNLAVPTQEIETRVREAIEMVGLDYEAIKDRSPFELSGGQKRRVAIAGVIAMRPRMLILDEPTAGLDPAGKRDILSLVLKLHQKCSPTIVIISHNMDEVADITDRIAVLKDGVVEAVDTVSAIFGDRDLVQRCRLELPMASRVALALKDRGLDIGYMPVRKSALTDTLVSICGGGL